MQSTVQRIYELIYIILSVTCNPILGERCRRLVELIPCSVSGCKGDYVLYCMIYEFKYIYSRIFKWKKTAKILVYLNI